MAGEVGGGWLWGEWGGVGGGEVGGGAQTREWNKGLSPTGT